MFWYNDIYLNKNINPTPFFEFQINGKDGVMKKIDDYTVAFEFPEPYPVLRFPARGQHRHRRAGSRRAAASRTSAAPMRRPIT